MNVRYLNHRAIAALICLWICGICSAASANRFGELYAGTFPVGSVVLPMNGNQPEAGRIAAYGLAHRVLRDGGYIYRIIQANGETAHLMTDLHPGGMDFFGGPILVLPQNAALIRNLRDNFFPEVSIEVLQEPFYSEAIFPAFRPLSICVIYGSHGRTDALLDQMHIPYILFLKSQVEANPSAMSSYDLIVDDCPGWFGFVPNGVRNALETLASDGKELIFTDIAVKDLCLIFPGKATLVANRDGTFDFTFHNNGDFLTQYSGDEVVPLFTDGGGYIASQVSSDVKVAVDSPNYGSPPFYAIAAFYFKQGSGIVEGFAYHPKDQISLSFASQYAAAALYGNKFVEGKAQPRITLGPPTAVNQVGMTHQVVATVQDILGQPKPGVLVTFSVISGPHAGATGTGATGSDGRATWSYVGSIVGEDTIQASFEESDPFGTVVYESNKVYKTWVTPASRNPGQAYPARSAGGLNRAFLGHKGLGDDTVTAMGGVFRIVPGEKWSNFIKAAQIGVPYFVKNVVLSKTTPLIGQCRYVFPQKDIRQRGTPAIRLWWPLLYEIPETKWTLSILYGTYSPVQLPGESAPSTAHFETWEWTVDINLEDIDSFLDAIHELPFGTSEVPIISDERVYLELKKLLQDAKDALDREDMLAVSMILDEFEMTVMDHCIPDPPLKPAPSGPYTGIAENDCHPACCKLAVDAEYVRNKLMGEKWP